MENLIEKKLRKVDVPILTTFLSSPIFIPVSKKINREETPLKTINIYCTKNIKIKAKVPLLDMTIDFPIWATALKALSEQENLMVTIEEKKFLNLLGIGKSNLNTKSLNNIDRRLEAMLSAIITTEFLNDNGELLDKVYINLFSKARWFREKGIFEFHFNPDIYNAYQKVKWKAIDMDYYKNIKTEHAKALFLFYESHSDYLIPIEKETLIKRLDLSDYSRGNNITLKINLAHDVLKEIGFIKDYEIVKDKSTGKVFYKVQKINKKNRCLF